ncbi:MAG: hypothetical protein ACRCVW_00150 [Brevinema sp.]
MTFLLDQEFTNRYDISAHIGFDYLNKKMLYRIDIGFRSISKDISLGLRLGVRLF